jgi:hypothetical protein
VVEGSPRVKKLQHFVFEVIDTLRHFAKQVENDGLQMQTSPDFTDSLS